MKPVQVINRFERDNLLWQEIAATFDVHNKTSITEEDLGVYELKDSCLNIIFPLLQQIENETGIPIQEFCPQARRDFHGFAGISLDGGGYDQFFTHKLF